MANTITNQLKKVLLEILVDTTIPIPERLEASSLLTEVRKLAKKRDQTTPRKQPKIPRRLLGILGSFGAWQE